MVPTFQSERIGPVKFLYFHTNVPFCNAVRLGFFTGFGLGFGCVVVVDGTVVVVAMGVVVVVPGAVVVVVGSVVVVVVVVVVGFFFVPAGTKVTGR